MRGDIDRGACTGNPHLLSRTVCALRESEYEFFCRNMLSLPFALLKEVLDSLRTEVRQDLVVT